MVQKKYIQMKTRKRNQRNKLKTMLVLALLLISMSSCKSDGIINIALERGKPIDLAQIDFQKLDLDNFLAKLAYAKESKMSTDKHVNTKNETLNIKWFTLYNITDNQLLERYKKRENYVIKKGEAYGDLFSIDRTAPLLSMRNPDLRSFGYWNSKEISFNSIYTSSTPNNKLIRVILDANNLHNLGQKEYIVLFQSLKKQFKDAEFKEDPQSNGVPSYQWTLKDKVIQLYFSKVEDLNSFTLKIAYINPDTKGYLKEFGN